MRQGLALFATLALLVGCGGAEKTGNEGFGELDSGGGGDDSSIASSDSDLVFDVSDDTNVGDAITTVDATCAKTEAAAIKPPVDVIMSIDQSGSMSDDIANVKANVNKLSDFLAKTGLDYRVVMIGTPGTSTYNICVPAPLGVGAPSCASNPPKFRSVSQNVQSHDTLKLILSTYDSPTGSATAWADFLRKDAVKVFIPVTDDDSNGSNPTSTAFDTSLLAKPGGQFGTAAKRNYVVYPIVGAKPSPDEATKCGSNAVNTGPQYVSLAKLTKGQWFPICITDFGPVFEEIAKNVATRVACELTVPPPPTGEKLDPKKVNVSYTPSTGATEPILQDASKPCDMGANGWQYSADGTKILLCGDACKKAQDDLGAKISVEFGCETKIKPPS
ncbi:MAG: hypothetical protein ACXWUG_20505 [Polyangiales bacterium]